MPTHRTAGSRPGRPAPSTSRDPGPEADPVTEPLPVFRGGAEPPGRVAGDGFRGDGVHGNEAGGTDGDGGGVHGDGVHGNGAGGIRDDGDGADSRDHPADGHPEHGRRGHLGHGHGHGHGPAAPAGRRARLLIAALLAPCALAALIGLVLLRPTGALPHPTASAAQQPVRADVVAAQQADCAPGDGQGACTGLTVHMTDGPRADRDLVQIVPREPGTPRFAVGDPVVLAWSGGSPDDPGSYQVVDYQRGPALGWLAVLFGAAVLALGRWRGLAALVALGVGFVVLVLFVLPAILSGRSPLAVAVVGAGVIMFAILYMTHGFSARTSTAVVGTLVSLALIGVLGAGFSAAARLTGLDDQTQSLITSLGTGVDARGLLLAGVVIGALGVLDDVTITQTSAVWELHAADPGLGATGLFRAAMRIGCDHVASAVNTLVLAYAGATLPLLLVFRLSGRSLLEVATTQDVAMEIVRTLVGSIGLVASVPVTTAVAALVASREEAPGPQDPRRGRAGSPRRRLRGGGARSTPGTPTAAHPQPPGTAPGRRRPPTAR